MGEVADVWFWNKSQDKNPPRIRGNLLEKMLAVSSTKYA